MTSAQRGDVEMQTTVLISCVSGTVTRGGGKGKKIRTFLWMSLMEAPKGNYQWLGYFS